MSSPKLLVTQDEGPRFAIKTSGLFTYSIEIIWINETLRDGAFDFLLKVRRLIEAVMLFSLISIKFIPKVLSRFLGICHIFTDILQLLSSDATPKWMSKLS